MSVTTYLREDVRQPRWVMWCLWLALWTNFINALVHLIAWFA